MRVSRLGLGFAALLTLGQAAQAAECGNSAGGFDAWKANFAREVGSKFSPRAVNALMSTSYAQATINADRGQHSFKLSLSAFCQKRGCAVIAQRGKKLKHQYANLFADIESRYGVPAGPLLAIWGMETGFGAVAGHQNVLSAVATLAYDCRRTEYFTDQLNAALTLVDRGVFSAGTTGSMHGEVGQTQFMPKTVLQFQAGGSLETAAGALTSTANYLKGHGWTRGAGYAPGEPNYNAIAEWNAATVYQEAIAKVGAEIDAAP
ncbi:Membrane-bound lytic murein transglycosylase B [Rhodoblastus acidophilus]|uniref:Membrane-bound lytic murein transglycosylase B n=1 Tax=Rhodoblastus acidophilus TaxID=1074 RepID=A0A212PXF8_RHOAC|nr:lytic transglycosylase domain-containing protein [Rhodoblastus acidophilus]MCW2316639.1 membrane-bound lytic murein transglycosylase B [Rhodoblastus acidophilus]SNB51638.1 Membrane-bound lytic murein transglycosylase B [Rhodoblastus acidophilus]